MRTDLLARAIAEHRLTAHLGVPAALTLLLLGLYFSGSTSLQAIVAPTIEGLHPFSWREFGALEILQNFVLLATVALFATAVRSAAGWPLKCLFALAAVGFTFILLEEVDYGAHWIEWLTGDLGSLSPETWDRNLHNRLTADGVQYGNYMRQAARVLVVVGFVLAPLVLPRSRNARLRLLAPSRWMIPTVLLMVVLSVLAHALDDAGLGTIGGVPGNLDHNISEFRELNFYYLFALYAAELNGRLRHGVGDQ